MARFGCAILPVAICATVGGLAHAEELRQPTDTELRAAYCIALVERQSKIMTREDVAKLPNANAALRQYDEVEKDDADLLDRLRTYLVPRMPVIDPIPIQGAMNRGSVDARAAMTQTDAAFDTCADRQTVKCLNDAVAASPVLKRAHQCYSFEGLPF